MMEQKTRKLPRFLAGLLSLGVLLGISSAGAVSMTAEQAAWRTEYYYQASLDEVKATTFAGYCARSVNWHLVMLGINTRCIACNGNQEWDTYYQRGVSDGGYPIRTFSAQDHSFQTALETVARSDNTSNILVCFEKGRSAAGQRYGHTFYIHSIVGDTVYFAESFHSQWPQEDGSLLDIPEGKLITASIAQVAAYYNNCEFEGLIQFLDKKLSREAILSAKHPYTDIYQPWQTEAIADCYTKGILNGISETSFDPESPLNFAQVGSVLYRFYGNMEGGRPAPSENGTPSTSPARDLAQQAEAPAEALEMETIVALAEEAPASEVLPAASDPALMEILVAQSNPWYTEALTWASNMLGLESDQPLHKVSREELVYMLYTFASCYLCDSLQNTADLSQYSDVSSVSPWAKDAFAWAVGNGILRGTSDATLSPQNKTTRGEAAVVFSKLSQMFAN